MKTKKLPFLGFFIFMLGIFSSCIFLGPSIKGNGNVIEQERNIKDFEEIEVTTGMNVWITQGEQTKVVVVADENLQDVIFTEVSGNTLKVYTDSRIKWAKENKVLITINKLDKIAATAGSNVFSNGTLSFEKLKVSTSAGSNAKLDVFSKELDIKSSSGSNAIIKGKAYDATLDASSGSNIRIKDLEATNCDADASSGANIFVTILKQLNGKASSGGNIFYYGNPQKINIDTSSGGNVINKE